MKTNTKKATIDPKKTKRVEYDKSDFRKKLGAVKDAINKTESFKSADDSKLHYTFSI